MTATAAPRRPLVRLLVGLAFVVPVFVAQVAVWSLRGTLGTLPTAALSATIASVGGWAAYGAFVRRFERRTVTEFGGAGAGRELAAGLVLGLSLIALVIGVLALLGAYRVAGIGDPSSLVLALLMSIGAGTIEEIMLRGVVFRLVEEWGGSWLGILLSALLFGAGHAATPHASVTGMVAIAVEAGVLLAAAYLLTRRLWLPIGIHIGWNLAEGGIFGVPTSGWPIRGVLRGELSGPEWLSGGAFGPEASIVTIAVCLALATSLLVLAARRGRFIASPRRRAARAEADPRISSRAS